MTIQIDFKTEINNMSSEINYLVNSENFTRQEAIKLVLTLAHMDQIFHKLARKATRGDN